ncbi:unnamed protein product [Prorocentrum cordatum]|uniref:Uncharacterized protein n=1 Tax=Prorocentrum cordatum TaxID=2364126 RepID=A0ABN9YF01_9DINO|nr:unnamed protein product [Polarella glacialis]
MFLDVARQSKCRSPEVARVLRFVTWLNRDVTMSRWFADVASKDNALLFITQMLCTSGLSGYIVGLLLRRGNVEALRGLLAQWVRAEGSLGDVVQTFAEKPLAARALAKVITTPGFWDRLVFGKLALQPGLELEVLAMEAVALVGVRGILEVVLPLAVSAVGVAITIVILDSFNPSELASELVSLFEAEPLAAWAATVTLGTASGLRGLGTASGARRVRARVLRGGLPDAIRSAFGPLRGSPVAAWHVCDRPGSLCPELEPGRLPCSAPVSAVPDCEHPEKPATAVRDSEKCPPLQHLECESQRMWPCGACSRRAARGDGGAGACDRAVVGDYMGVQGANPKRLVNRKPLGPGHRLVAPRESTKDGPQREPTRAQLDRRPATSSQFGTGAGREHVGDGAEGEGDQREPVEDLEGAPELNSISNLHFFPQLRPALQDAVRDDSRASDSD